jgi:hypothetical protein
MALLKPALILKVSFRNWFALIIVVALVFKKRMFNHRTRVGEELAKYSLGEGFPQG